MSANAIPPTAQVRIDDHGDDHDRGIVADLDIILGRRRALWWLGGAVAGTVAGGALVSGAVHAISEIPTETAGPYPGDGSNGPNALTTSGVVRSDIRSSFGPYSGTADGVELTVRLRILDTTNDGALAGYAVYLWHATADGGYSLYSSGHTDQNYLRGVQTTDDDGWVTFTTIYPACYSGRWPHIHFEVFESLSDITSATNAVKTTQLALPRSMSDEVYADSRYAGSASRLAGMSLSTDNVFSDDAGVLQVATITGAIGSDLTATLDVGVDAGGAGDTTGGGEETTIVPTSAPASIGDPSRFVPLDPARVLDTRSAQIGYSGSKPSAQTTVALDVLGRGGVPTSGVSAVMLNVAMVQADAGGFLTVWPDGSRPEASSVVTDADGQTRANVVTVPVADDGTVRLFTWNPAHLLADVVGYFSPVASSRGGRMVVATPARVLDTRPGELVNWTAGQPSGGTIIDVPIAGFGGVPTSGVGSVVMNITVAQTAGAGWLAVHPDAIPSSTSSLNFDGADQTRANQVVAPLDAGSVPIYVHTDAHVIIDVFGWLTDDTADDEADGLIVPVSPYRVLDTRDLSAIEPGDLIHLAAAADGTAGEGRSGLNLNLTAVQPAGRSYVTVWPDGDQPGVSNLNCTSSGQRIANLAALGTSSSGSVDIAVSRRLDLVVDVTAWYV